jgi:hypothetical protein
MFMTGSIGSTVRVFIARPCLKPNTGNAGLIVLNPKPIHASSDRLKVASGWESANCNSTSKVNMQIDERDRLTSDASQIYQFLTSKKKATWDEIETEFAESINSTSILEALFELEERDLIIDQTNQFYQILENPHS